MNSSLLPISRPEGTFYSVQLTDSEYRTWENIDGQADQLTFRWSNMNANMYGTLQDLMIAVAKVNTDKDGRKIKHMAKAIRQTKAIKEEDRIFGIREQTLEKIGYISKKTIIGSQDLALNINWVSDEEIGQLPEYLFDEDLEIQRLTEKDLEDMERKFGAELQEIYKRLPALTHHEQHSYSQNKESINREFNFKTLPGDRKEDKFLYFMVLIEIA